MSLGILCSGQGGQHAAMFDLLEREGSGEPLIARASESAGFAIREAVRTSTARSMFHNAVAQPLICGYQGVVWSMLETRLAAAGVVPAVVAGYSVGELASHGCAGSVSWADVVALARVRAGAMDTAGRGTGLAAVRGVARARLDAALTANGSFVAIVNGDDQWIVGGPGAALDALVADLARGGAAAQRLPVAVAAHTPLLGDAVEPFRRALAEVAWQAPRVPVIAGVDATLVRDASTAIDRLARQLATPIRWSACMDATVEAGATVCLELGPGNALARLVRERHRGIAARSVEDFRSLDAVVDWVVEALA